MIRPSPTCTFVEITAFLLPASDQGQNAVLILVPRESALFQSRIELCGTAAEFIVLRGKSTIRAVQFAGLFLQAVAGFTAFLQKMCHPVVVSLVETKAAAPEQHHSGAVFAVNP